MPLLYFDIIEGRAVVDACQVLERDRYSSELVVLYDRK
jgi:hypothetical protein